MCFDPQLECAKAGCLLEEIGVIKDWEGEEERDWEEEVGGGGGKGLGGRERRGRGIGRRGRRRIRRRGEEKGERREIGVGGEGKYCVAGRNWLLKFKHVICWPPVFSMAYKKRYGIRFLSCIRTSISHHLHTF